MGKKKILIIDDDEDLLEELQETLNISGYKTIAIKDSTCAFDTAYKFRPDLILLDLKMNDMNGFQVATSLKRFPSTTHIPIIAMTGFFNKKHHFKLMDLCGMNMCLEKPFNPPDLIVLIKEIFKEGGKYPKNDGDTQP